MKPVLVALCGMSYRWVKKRCCCVGTKVNHSVCRMAECGMMQLRCRDSGNEHKKLDELSDRGQLAVFMIVGQAALLTLLISPSFFITVTAVLYDQERVNMLLGEERTRFYLGTPTRHARSGAMSERAVT